MRPRHNQSGASARSVTPSSPPKRSSDPVPKARTAERAAEETKPAVERPTGDGGANVASPPSQRPAEQVSNPARSIQHAADKTFTHQGHGEKSIEFKLRHPQAKSAFVAGSFNSWDMKRTPMRKEGDGEWRAAVSLPPGRYEYRFVVDGQWVSDPSAKESVSNTFGSSNSILVV